jgi:hypothetical protein
MFLLLQVVSREHVDVEEIIADFVTRGDIPEHLVLEHGPKRF